MNLFVLYLLSFLLAWTVTRICLPVTQKLLGNRLSDMPQGQLKKHAKITPVTGGCAIFIGTLVSLTIIRFITNFPTGTLHNLRGIFIGGTLIFLLGILDDLHKPEGLSVPVKLMVQTFAAASLIYYGITIHFIAWKGLASIITFLWLVGLTNAFNLLDIQDGLCTSQAVICALGLTVIALPSEFLYVNFAAIALLGACIAFWPKNHSQNKIFLGDSGSTFLGFMIAALSIGTGYSGKVSSGFLAPLFILAVPLFDTFFVSMARILKGKNPLQGSDDHIALRLARHGWKKTTILTVFCAVAVVFNLLAFVLTVCSLPLAICLFSMAFLAGLFLTRYLLQLD